MMIAAMMCMTVEILTIQVTAETAEMMVTANRKLDYTFYIKHHKIKDIKLQNLSTLQVHSITTNSNGCRKDEKEGG
jgi:hypothetical protein